MMLFPSESADNTGPRAAQFTDALKEYFNSPPCRCRRRSAFCVIGKSRAWYEVIIML